MTRHSPPWRPGSEPTSVSSWHRPFNSPADALQELWHTLNLRYFEGALTPITIEWSRRLTSSAGLFISRERPRPRRINTGPVLERRLIRLSAPLIQTPDVCSNSVLLTTLAHEMIHQWQFDVLRRRPNHGPDFRRKMSDLNRDGLGITIRHGLDDRVQAFAKYTWRCKQCGRAYKRQRRTIDPKRHRCGKCHGSLRELGEQTDPPLPTGCVERLTAGLLKRLTHLNRGGMLGRPPQVFLPFAGQ